MSRKSIFALLGVLLVFLKGAFGLAIEPIAFLSVIAYLIFEAKLDARRFASQIGRFKDPKFWVAFFTTILPVLNTEFGFNLPIDTILIVLNLLLTYLFGRAFKKEG